MRRIVLESDNEEALAILESQAREMQVSFLEDSDSSKQETTLVKLSLDNLKEIAGSLSDLNLDAAELRQEAWDRNKSKY